MGGRGKGWLLVNRGVEILYPNTQRLMPDFEFFAYPSIGGYIVQALLFVYGMHYFLGSGRTFQSHNGAVELLCLSSSCCSRDSTVSSLP